MRGFGFILLRRLISPPPGRYIKLLLLKGLVNFIIGLVLVCITVEASTIIHSCVLSLQTLSCKNNVLLEVAPVIMNLFLSYNL